MSSSGTGIDVAGAIDAAVEETLVNVKSVNMSAVIIKIAEEQCLC